MKSALKYVPIITFVRPTILVSFLCVLCASVVNSPAQDFKTVHDGVEHAQVSHRLGEEPVKINLLRLDLTKVRLDVHHALDRAIGLENTSSIAIRKKAVGAINAGFFRLDKTEFAGDPSDYLVIDGNIISEGNRNRTGVMIVNGKKMSQVSFPSSNLNAWLGSQESRFMIKTSGVNRLREDDEIILFGADFAQVASKNPGGINLLLNNCARGRKFWSNLVYCRDISMNPEGVGNSSVPVGGYIVSIGPNRFKDKEHLLNEVRVFQTLPSKKKSLYIKIEDSATKVSNFTEEVDMVAGVPQLIKNGKIDITWEQEKASKAFVETRNPRTAVAKMKDGKFLMITVDGRQPGVSVGMSLPELAEYLLNLGAVDAMNLDGGGSTTMFLDGKVVNTPSDKEGERKIGDAILVTLRKEPSKK